VGDPGEEGWARFMPSYKSDIEAISAKVKQEFAAEAKAKIELSRSQFVS
jgi:hypothetical protein